MKRWMIATILMVSLVGAVGWHAPAVAQDIPTAGQVGEFLVEDGHPIALSPDGTMYAVAIQRTALCVYDTETQQELSCASLERLDAGIRNEDVVWSPDSTRLAFGEHALRLGNDGDLWVMDARSGELTNLTDDSYEGSMFSFDNSTDNATFYIDIAPAWTPDSQFITFSRSGFVLGERTGNDIAQVPAAGGDVEILATIPNADAGAVYGGTGWDPSGETLYFTLTHLDLDDPENGIWTYDAATRVIAPLAKGDDAELGPLMLLRVSPTGEHLLAWYPMAFGQFDVDTPLLRLVDTATGALSTPEIPAPAGSRLQTSATAAFSPDGQALLLVVSQGGGLFQVWVSDLAGGEPQLLIDEIENAFLDPGLMPTWGSNGTVLLGKGTGGGYLFSVDGIGLDAMPSPVASSGTPVGSSSQSFAAGDIVMAIGIAPVFAAPDPNAMVVLVLTPGAEVQILGDLVATDAGRWYPVLDPQTQTIGYVQADRLGTIG